MFKYDDDQSIGARLWSVDLKLTITSVKSRAGSKSHTYLADVTSSEDATEEVLAHFPAVGQRPVIIKLPKCPSKMQDISRKNRFARIAYMQTIEAHSSNKLSGLKDAVAKVLYSEVFSCEINGKRERLPVIVQEYIEGETLEEFLTRTHPGANGEFAGVPSAAQFFSYAYDLTKVVQSVHRAQVIHGDISSNNFMVRKRSNDSNSQKGTTEAERPQVISLGDRICIIDFGEAAFLDEFGLGELGSLGMLYERLERVSEAYDIRQLGLLLAHLCGCVTSRLEMAVRDLIVPSARRDAIFKQINEVNPQLLRSSPGIVEVISACVCPIVELRPRRAGDVLSMLEIFVAEKESEGDVFSKTAARTHRTHGGEILDSIVQRSRARLISRELDRVANVQHIDGSREEIELGLCSVMGRLRAKDEYLTLTYPGFWSEINLQMHGAFFTMNRVALTRGARIGRIFVVSDGELISDKRRARVVALLRVHLELQKEFSHGERPLYEVKYLRVSEDYRRRLIIDGNNFGLLSIPVKEEGGSIASKRGDETRELITASLRYSGERICGVTFAMKDDVGWEFGERYKYFQKIARPLDSDVISEIECINSESWYSRSGYLG